MRSVDVNNRDSSGKPQVIIVFFMTDETKQMTFKDKREVPKKQGYLNRLSDLTDCF